MTSYTWPLTINGVTFTAADFEPYGYVTAVPNLIGNFGAYAASVHALIADDKADAVAAAATAAASAINAAGNATTAATKAGEAATSATNAGSSATTATTKAGEAATSATSAAGNAATATTKAAEAAASATNAAGNATIASTRAGEATTSATNAVGSAATATAKASEAATSATNAADSAITAITKAGEASNSTIAAAGWATAAANSAADAAAAADAASGGGIKVTASDTMPGLLDTSITVSGAIIKSVTDPGGNERLNLSVDLSAYALKVSPTLTGTPTAPTASADTTTAQVATTAFVAGQAGTTSPMMDGTASAGSSLRYARQDHAHPTDTSRAPLASPAFTGVPTVPTASAGTSTTQIASTAFVEARAIAAPTTAEVLWTRAFI